MKRRQFITKSSAGLAFTMIGAGMWSCESSKPKEMSFEFKTLDKGKTPDKVYQVTPDDGYYIHTYYDVCPFSPSGRYLVVSKLPIQGRHPVLGEKADICIVDLERRTIRTVYTTKCWGFQVGANAQWGVDDRYIYANDIFESGAVCVRIDLETGALLAYNGPKYDIAPDASCVIGPKLELMDFTQQGYGAPTTPNRNYELPQGAHPNEGIWKSDLKSLETSLFLSLHEASQHLSDQQYFQKGTFYFWHCKFNRQNTRIMQVIRCIFPQEVKDKYPAKKGHNPSVLTLKADGSDIRETVTRVQWSFGGHHPNWHPDGEHIIMNLTPKWLGDNNMRFCQVKYDGTDFKILTTKYLGSGHPSIEQSGRYLVSDAYPRETAFSRDGKVPIRLLDLQANHEETICWIYTDIGKPRCDAHPVWSRDYKQICFNGAPSGNRQVFIAELNKII